jgi:TatD DNase family protein
VLVDTHCHLDFNSFIDDRQLVVDRARQNGVERILNPAIHLASSYEISRMAESIDEVYVAVGVHPNEALTWESDTLDRLREAAHHSKVVAIGEIGLDYYRDYSPRDLQRRVFIHQLELAAELNLPVIIHNRQASEDVLELLVAWHAALIKSNSPLQDRPGVLHSFSDQLSVARQAIDIGFFIGFTGPITYRNAQNLQELVKSIPLDCLLTETDAPFLPPQPYRGKRNEPAYVRLVAEKISELLEVDYQTVAKATTVNANQLFGWWTNN